MSSDAGFPPQERLSVSMVSNFAAAAVSAPAAGFAFTAGPSFSRVARSRSARVFSSMRIAEYCSCALPLVAVSIFIWLMTESSIAQMFLWSCGLLAPLWALITASPRRMATLRRPPLTSSDVVAPLHEWLRVSMVSHTLPAQVRVSTALSVFMVGTVGAASYSATRFARVACPVRVRREDRLCGLCGMPGVLVRRLRRVSVRPQLAAVRRPGALVLAASLLVGARWPPAMLRRPTSVASRNRRGRYTILLRAFFLQA